MVQNKMHWAAHDRTAAEVIYERANAEKPNMGLTAWKKGHPPARTDTLFVIVISLTFAHILSSIDSFIIAKIKIHFSRRMLSSWRIHE